MVGTEVVSREKIRGDCTFIDDIVLDSSVFGLTVRSSIECGEIVSISVPELPEGYVCVRAQDIPGENAVTFFGRGMPVLAQTEVHYVGEPVLLLGGPDKALLVSLASRVVIEYRATSGPRTTSGVECSTLKHSRGNTPQAFQDAYQIVEGHYRCAPQEAQYLEAQGAVARADGNSVLVYSSTQHPYHVRDTVEGVLGIPKSRVRVIVPDVGGGSGGKMEFPSLIAAHASLLSWVSERPARLIYTPTEGASFTSKRHPCSIRHKTALDRDGNILGMDVEMALDAGAYELLSPMTLERALLSACGCYRCDNLEITATLSLTNSVPSGIFRGDGAVPSFLAVELHGSRMAELSQVDPYLWRKRNIVSDPRAHEVLDDVVRRSDFQRRHAAYEAMKKRRKDFLSSRTPVRGIGLAVSYFGVGLVGTREGEKAYSVKVRLERDRSLRVLSSVVEMGQGAHASLAMIASKVLGIDLHRITVEPVDTSVVPDSGPTVGSRSIAIVGRLVEQCCRSIQRKRIRDILPIEARRSYHLPKDVRWDPDSMKGDAFPVGSFGGTVVEVEVDPDSLEVGCRGLWMTADSGKLLDSVSARVHVENGVLQGLGLASGEDAGAGGYFIPGAFDSVPVNVHFIEEPDVRGAFGAKGVGELSVVGVAPAYVAAVSQATGFHIDRIPLTSQVIQEYVDVR